MTTALRKGLYGFNKGLKAQTMSEYAVLITLITVGLFAMQVYVKRGLSGHYKDMMDYTSNKPGTNFTTMQYEPDYSYTNSRSHYGSTSSDSMEIGGKIWRSSYSCSSMQMTEFINGS